MDQPVPIANHNYSVSAPIASNSSSSTNTQSPLSTSGSGSSVSNSIPSLSSCSSSSIASSNAPSISGDMLHLPPSVLAQIAQQYANGNGSSTSRSDGQYHHPENGALNGGPKYVISAESWKHQAQARAILGNLIGPNGEQLTSTDPYNTTVFVGGLSPLINEETLRSFFAPFGDIHYVGGFFLVGTAEANV
jgi:RNA recognition motif. (a.k.a. RRM, RBD, or RNP domain)